MKTHGVQGASLSLDSADPARHDEFRHLPGAWSAAVRATEALRAERIDFSLHMSVTDWNVGEIPAMIDLSRELGARVLNFFFLVRTGRGEGLTDITPAQYEEILTYLARTQGAGRAPEGPAPDSVLERREDPWSVPVGRAGGLLIRAKCAPHFRRVLYELDPDSPLLANYAHGSCPAGKYYCRITPTGDVTPCPYMPVAAGNLRETGFAELWERAGGLHGAPAPAARRPVRRLRVPRALRRLPLPRLRDLRRLPRRGPGLRLPAGRPRGRADPTRGRADVRARGAVRARVGAGGPGPPRRDPGVRPRAWWSRRSRPTRAARARRR